MKQLADFVAYADGGPVRLGDDSYEFDGDVHLPAGLVGGGKGSTILRARSATARLCFGTRTESAHRGGVVGHFTVDGNGATNPLLIGAGSNRLFTNLRVYGGVDNIVVQSHQNSTFVAVESSDAGRDGLVIDAGAKNLGFHGLVVGSAGRHGIRVDMAWPHGTNDRVEQCDKIRLFGGLVEGTGDWAVVLMGCDQFEAFGTQISGGLFVTSIPHPTSHKWLDCGVALHGGSVDARQSGRPAVQAVGLRSQRPVRVWVSPATQLTGKGDVVKASGNAQVRTSIAVPWLPGLDT